MSRADQNLSLQLGGQRTALLALLLEPGHRDLLLDLIQLQLTLLLFSAESSHTIR